jgi:hypothetical protein
MGRERLQRYSLAGPENQAAVDAGLAGGAWFRSAVPRKRMKELMRRSDGPAIRDTAIWLGLMAVFAGLGIALWGSWRAVPFFLAYGVLYGSSSDSRWHEAGHQRPRQDAPVVRPGRNGVRRVMSAPSAIGPILGACGRRTGAGPTPASSSRCC